MVLCGASHNPPEYNGLKVYGADGGQIPPDAAEEIIRIINKIENELIIEVASEKDMLESGLLTYMGKKVNSAYIEQLKTLQLNTDMIKDVGNLLSHCIYYTSTS
ncbi:hypothetical protein ACQKMZ_28945 [Bacillus paramycoides]|uniref:hypothetical protein n=1 Tax=Bacillus paramycoides TaxID=2026194 RepID=UPI003D006D23